MTKNLDFFFRSSTLIEYLQTFYVHYLRVQTTQIAKQVMLEKKEEKKETRRKL